MSGPTPEPAYWHGGFPGIPVGAHLLSPQDAAVARIPISYTPREHPALGRVSRTDRVYFSTSEEFARAYAFQTEITTPSGQLASRGTLYQVQPVGTVEEDPDYAGHSVSWCSPRAIVIDVVETDVRMRLRDATKAIGIYMTWDDGRPIYLEDGRLSLTWQMESFGLTQDVLDRIVRPWTAVPDALERVQRHMTGGSPRT